MRLKKFGDPSLNFNAPDLTIAKRYLEVLEDIFVDVEDELGIKLSIFFYEFNPENPNSYKILDLSGERSNFWTTTINIYGYFSIDCLEKSDEIDLSKSKTFAKCVKRIYQFFDHKIEIETEFQKDYISAIIELKEPLV